MSPHSPSEQILIQLLLEKFDEITQIIERLPAGTLNARLAVEGSNSPAQILVHCCGMMRRWSSTVNLGVAIPRDRDAEFTVAHGAPQALALAAQARADFIGDLEQTNMQATPVNAPTGARAQYFEQTSQGVLLHVLEELCQHLGQLEITRDVLLDS